MKKYIISSVSILSILITSIAFASNDSLTNKFTQLDGFIKENIEAKVEEPEAQRVILGNERITTEFSYLIDGKKLGLVTNQTGINKDGLRTVDLLYKYPNSTLTSIYSPEHGLDGKAPAGAYVDSYVDKTLNLPVYSLYGSTRKPTTAMLKNVDVMIFDMQDIGSRTYTYMSTLNYVMKACKENNIPIIVLDRPNPLGGLIVEGYILEDKYETFVGVDNLPLQHGMTSGELAKFFNREIGSDLIVIPMKNYTRDMIWQETGIPFVQTSPNIPNINSAFCYIATGMGEGTTLGQADQFTWVGTTGINSTILANKLNSYNLPGVTFTPETKTTRGGVRLSITDYKKFNPARTSVYIITTVNQMKPLNIPVETNGVIPMFEKIWGTNRFGRALKSQASPEAVIASYQNELNAFKAVRKNYLIYN